LRLDYARAYWPHVVAIAKETGVDPYLILAVARQESTFRPSLTSSAGAQGVMQVMPGTAEWLAKAEPTIGPEHAKQLDVPTSSLRLGTYYLMRMIDRCGGNVADALASYNAGPGNLSKWRKQYPNADLDTFIESIPFSETRHYVKAVLGNYAAYHSLYPPETKP
jgi:soluble lytic murein transglycosylase